MMNYDYVILGGGASGLSLAHRMAIHPYFQDKKIALIEKERKVHNDRTWCYWSDNKGFYDNIAHQTWSKITFYSPSVTKQFDISPYKYRMIRGIDFYEHVYPILQNAKNIDIIYDAVINVSECHQGDVEVITSEKRIKAGHVFKSFSENNIDKTKTLYVDQHFKGFVIETKKDVFDVETPTFMDFRIPQCGETRFMYVLPTSSRKALVEVAVFSNELLTNQAYDTILKDYIKEYVTSEPYTIIEEEVGVIPMTTFPFWKNNTPRITHIGSAGGIVKATSGYAFERIQRHSDNIVECILLGKSLDKSYKGLFGKYLYYDKTMLHAMLRKGVAGESIFTALFSKLKPQDVFRFLNHDSSFAQDIKIFTAPPFWAFLTSFFSVIFSNRDV